MHRRDYVLIAKVLIKTKKIISNEYEWGKLVEEFCISLKEENSSFNKEKFIDYIQKGR